MNKYDKRVAKGIKYLDENAPDWKSRIEKSTLDMRTCNQCIIGQVFGSYINKFNNRSRRIPISLGFTVAESEEFPELTKAWMRVL